MRKTGGTEGTGGTCVCVGGGASQRTSSLYLRDEERELGQDEDFRGNVGRLSDNSSFTGQSMTDSTSHGFRGVFKGCFRGF